MGLLGSIVGAVGGFLVGGPSGAVAGAQLGSAFDSASAAGDASKAQTQASEAQLALQREMWEKQQANQQPWLEAGQTALNALVPIATQYRPFGMAQFQQDPGYQFRLSEGLKALDRQAAARGGLISGNALRAAERYGQEMGSQEYQNAFNRYQTERQARLNPLQSLAGVGQTAVNQLAAAGQNYATGAGQAYQNIGNARASGYVGQQNALNSALGGALGYYQQSQLAGQLTTPSLYSSTIPAAGGMSYQLPTFY